MLFELHTHIALVSDQKVLNKILSNQNDIN